MLEKRLLGRSFCYTSAPLPCAPALASASPRSRRTLLGRPPVGRASSAAADSRRPRGDRSDPGAAALARFRGPEGSDRDLRRRTHVAPRARRPAGGGFSLLTAGE